MRQLLLVLGIVCCTAGVALATTSSPADLLATSGSLAGTNFVSFAALGENAIGILTSTAYRSSAGISGMIYTPFISSVSESIPSVSTSLGIVISYPNPFNPMTQTSNIAYLLAQDAEVKIYIYDLSGSLIRQIATNSGSRAADGYSRYAWNGKDTYGAAVENGTYIVRIVSGGRVVGTTKIIAIR
jgi:hypothetical protein